MSSRVVQATLLLAVLLGMAGSPPVWGQATDPGIETLVQACQAAKGQFRALGQEDLAAVETDLKAAVNRLDERLHAETETGPGWRDYLHWDDVTRELGKPSGIDLEVLDQLYRRLIAGYEGLGLDSFLDVRRALRRYLSVARAVDNSRLPGQYEGLMDALAERLQKFDRQPNEADATAIAGALRWLDSARQASQLIDAVRQRYGQRNLYVDVSAELINAAMGQAVDDTMPVSDCILGTSVQGTGHTVGQVTVELVPSEERAVLRTRMEGTTDTDTIGYNGPVRIYSLGTTTLATGKEILLDAESLRTRPAETEAATSTKITGIGTRGRCGRQMIERIARRRVAQQKSQAEWIAARHAERQADDRIDQEVDGLIEQADLDLRTKLRRPLVQRRLFPRRLQFATSEKRLKIRVLQAGTYDLAAPGPPPQIAGQPDLAVRVHESSVNNFMAGALSGMIVREKRLQQVAVEMLGTLPEQLKSEPGAEPWGITFARSRPISVSFADHGFRLTIRGRKYARGENEYPGMYVTAAYRIENGPDGPRAVRTGPLEILPPGFIRGKSRLSARHQVIRDLLQRRLGRVFEEVLVPQPIELPGERGRGGKLRLVHWDAAGGWLSLGFKLQEPPPASPST